MPPYSEEEEEGKAAAPTTENENENENETWKEHATKVNTTKQQRPHPGPWKSR